MSIVDRKLMTAYAHGYRDGYESPDMPSDHVPINPYDPSLCDGEYTGPWPMTLWVNSPGDLIADLEALVDSTSGSQQLMLRAVLHAARKVNTP